MRRRGYAKIIDKSEVQRMPHSITGTEFYALVKATCKLTPLQNPKIHDNKCNNLPHGHILSHMK
jgi:hypothetical protein